MGCSKYLWAFILTIVSFILLCFLLEHISLQNKESDDDYNFSVTKSTVLSFTYNTTTTTFTYNLLLLVRVPNNHVSLDYVNATASYLDHRFASKPDEALVQGFTGLRMHFNGENVVHFTEDQISRLDKNHIAGLYNVTVRIWPSKMMKPGKRIGPAKTVVLCDIQVPHESRVPCGWTTDC
ncbi:hypothetical protein VNO80_01905 [Phaseolus coccineus]|uniref:Late embryogenesis abundant protein LEA-2 subgroup domain-containing protein n=1 Tax=Phaseolus coccineus TaxID=3886 RepID=A0AAN9WXW0_PHACN